MDELEEVEELEGQEVEEAQVLEEDQESRARFLESVTTFISNESDLGVLHCSCNSYSHFSSCLSICVCLNANQHLLHL